MNPQEKKFVITLSLITAACSAGLYFWSTSAGKSYDEAKTSYDEVANDISRINKLSLSPTEENIDAKQKNIKLFEAQSNKIISELRKFGADPLKNTDAQSFADKLVKEVAEVKEALKGTTLPSDFKLGFEKYDNTLALQGATGILSYQLDAISELTRAMAEAKPAEILSIFREPLAEEVGKEEVTSKDSIYRALPIEISFKGSEKALRSFLDATQESKKYFYIIRSMRVTNEKTSAPLASEARFETASVETEQTDPAFGEFVLPGEPTTPEKPKPEPEKTMASEVILKEVLGAENIKAFLRIDIVRFHQADMNVSPKKNRNN